MDSSNEPHEVHNIELMQSSVEHALICFKALYVISTVHGRAAFHLEIGCCQHQNTPRGLEPIHLSKKLVEGVVAHTPTPMLVSAPHRVQLINEDDARCSFPGSFEEGTHTLGATPVQLVGKLTSSPDMTAPC